MVQLGGRVTVNDYGVGSNPTGTAKFYGRDAEADEAGGCNPSLSQLESDRVLQFMPGFAAPEFETERINRLQFVRLSFNWTGSGIPNPVIWVRVPVGVPKIMAKVIAHRVCPDHKLPLVRRELRSGHVVRGYLWECPASLSLSQQKRIIRQTGKHFDKCFYHEHEEF